MAELVSISEKELEEKRKEQLSKEGFYNCVKVLCDDINDTISESATYLQTRQIQEDLCEILEFGKLNFRMKHKDEICSIETNLNDIVILSKNNTYCETVTNEILEILKKEYSFFTLVNNEHLKVLKTLEANSTTLKNKIDKILSKNQR